MIRTNIIISGVGGQGILSVAYVLSQAALERGWHVKQSEVHGMAQRGGAVLSHLRLSADPIASDLIPKGMCDLLISVEPLEAARYLGFLSPEATVVTNTAPMINIPDYPELSTIWSELDRVKLLIPIHAADLARQAGSPQAENTVLLGAASVFLDFPPESLETWISTLWKAKGERVVETNLKAFELGRKVAAYLERLSHEGTSPEELRALSEHIPTDLSNELHRVR